MKITKKTHGEMGLYLHICPLCGEDKASATEDYLLPEFSICDCDKNGNAWSDLELFENETEKWDLLND